MIFEAIEFFFLAVCVIAGICGCIYGILLLTGAWGVRKLAEATAEAEPSYAGRIRSSQTVTGTVTQIREIRPQIAGKASRYDYQLAVSYARGQEQLTALFGILSEQPLMLQEGSRVKLHIFKGPLMEPNKDAWQRTRLAAGFLPKESVHYRDYRGVPMDETATVMFEEDFQRFQSIEETEYLATDRQTLPDIMKIISAALAAVGIAIILFFFSLIK